MEEAIIALVRLHPEYTFQLAGKLQPSPLEVKQRLTIAQVGGVPVTVQRRNGSAPSIIVRDA